MKEQTFVISVIGAILLGCITLLFYGVTYGFH